MKLSRIELLVVEEDEDRFAGFLAQRVSWGWEVDYPESGRVRFVIYCETEDQTKATGRDSDPAQEFPRGVASELLRDVRREWPGVVCSESTYEDQDWSESWKEFFIPVRVEDTFLVLPPWLKSEGEASGLIPLLIEPKMAFGTGHHATTALCLKAIAMLWREEAVSGNTGFLDLGTGSGILALACAKLGMTGLALDIDPVAVANALENMALNDVSQGVAIRKGGLEILDPDRRFGLILANILAGPLVHMAPTLARRLESGAGMVLSGILREQAERVENAYRDQGLATPRRLTEGEWVALIWA
ncbi:50S ribosomal protein L11 methyltransferase [Desulfonatronum lacustre]|uniref:50S ribosomal protein L11 methyltransferase n=1 Tax=Desulfonatronum lacustre TaxID=66849 RepID=UPI00048C0608|nr:50S ribosomal protein L11 methyltransferase [Desulfonatronum lacustre]